MQPIIHQRDKLDPIDYRRLHASGLTQEEKIARFFRSQPDQSFIFAEVMEHFSMDKDSCKRSISNLSNNKPSGPWLDENGQAPLIKLTQKRKNKKSGVRCHLFQWNPAYGRKKDESQLSMFGGAEVRV